MGCGASTVMTADLDKQLAHGNFGTHNAEEMEQIAENETKLLKGDLIQQQHARKVREEKMMEIHWRRSVLAEKISGQIMEEDERLSLTSRSRTTSRATSRTGTPTLRALGTPYSAAGETRHRGGRRKNSRVTARNTNNQDPTLSNMTSNTNANQEKDAVRRVKMSSEDYVIGNDVAPDATETSTMETDVQNDETIVNRTAREKPSAPKDGECTHPSEIIAKSVSVEGLDGVLEPAADPNIKDVKVPTLPKLNTKKKRKIDKSQNQGTSFQDKENDGKVDW